VSSGNRNLCGEPMRGGQGEIWWLWMSEKEKARGLLLGVEYELRTRLEALSLGLNVSSE